MRSVKIFVISISIMMGFMALAALLLPSKVTVSKSILIDATKTDVAEEIQDFNSWKNWYPPFQNGTVTITTLQKGDSSFVMVTDERQRKLTMAMIRPRPENINILLSTGNRNDVTWQFIITPGRAQTQLTWNVNTTFSWYPWEKIKGIFLDKVTGRQYQEALQSLKITVEKMHQ